MLHYYWTLDTVYIGQYLSYFIKYFFKLLVQFDKPMYNLCLSWSCLYPVANDNRNSINLLSAFWICLQYYEIFIIFFVQCLNDLFLHIWIHSTLLKIFVFASPAIYFCCFWILFQYIWPFRSIFPIHFFFKFFQIFNSHAYIPVD